MLPIKKLSKRKDSDQDDNQVNRISAIKKHQRAKEAVKEEHGDACEQSSDDAGESADEFVDQNIEVEFEAFPPDESDFQGIKKLLKQTLLKESIDLSDLTNFIIGLTDLTVVIKQSLNEQEDGDDDEDEVYGVTTLVDLSLDQRACVRQLNEYLIGHSQEFSQDDELRRIIANQLENKKNVLNKLALVVSERFVNLPPQLCVPAYDSLLDEIKKDKTLKFDYFVLISKVLKVKHDDTKTKKSRKDKTKPDADVVVYLNPEEEIFDEKANFTFEFSVADQCDGDHKDGHWDEEDQSYIPFRRIMVFEAENFFSIVKSLKHEL